MIGASAKVTSWTSFRAWNTFLARRNRWIPRFHSPGTIGLPTAHCSGRPPHAGSIPPTAVVDWLSVNLLPSPCLHLTILESGTLSSTTWYYHALPQTLIVWQRHFTLTSRRLFLRLLKKAPKTSVLGAFDAQTRVLISDNLALAELQGLGSAPAKHPVIPSLST